MDRNYANEVVATPPRVRGESADSPQAPLRARLETTRETLNRALEALCAADVAIHGPSPDALAKRPESMSIMGIADDNDEIASAIGGLAGRILRALGPLKG